MYGLGNKLFKGIAHSFLIPRSKIITLYEDVMGTDGIIFYYSVDETDTDRYWEWHNFMIHTYLLPKDIN